jgi:hypothetical protein
MPEHTIPRADLSRRVAQLEADGEVVVSVVAEGDDDLIVFTRSVDERRAKPGEQETR